MHANEGLMEVTDILVNELEFETQIILQSETFTDEPGMEFIGLTPPAFTGYAPISSGSLAWPDAAVGTGDEIFVNGPLCVFECTADGSPWSIYGIVFCIKRTGGDWKIWFYGEFESVETVELDGDKVEKKFNFRDRNY